jgi:hypothetical protein
MAHPWRTPGFLGVERSPPLAMSSGKILHLHRRGSERQDGGARQRLEGAVPSG